MLTITGEIAPVTVNVYTNGTVIVNAFTVTGATSPVIVNVYTYGSLCSRWCSWKIKPYLLIFKRRQNLKMLSAAKYRWLFKSSFVDLLCFCSVLCLLCFVRVCLYVLRGHLLGKGWPLGSRLWCLLSVCHFPIGILGQVWYLIVSIPDLCNLTYFNISMVQLHLHTNEDIKGNKRYDNYSTSIVFTTFSIRFWKS